MHTGQHYDDELSAIFVRELDMPPPDIELGLGGGSNTEQTARMLGALGDLLRDERPDAVLVYGDTNSTLAGALAAAQARIPVAHVEAGMRSFDRAMPEELNRVVTDHVSDLLLVPSQNAADNLAREGVGAATCRSSATSWSTSRGCSRRARAPTTARCGRPACAPASTCSSPRTAPAPSTTRSAWRASSSCCWASSCRSCCRCTRAPARAWRRPGCWTACRPV